ncbi:alpha/beta fold hydrolase [Thalassobaculum litoreum]|uniref:Pimeloyl-ACP methyl ester carboxylesterase n=1 Tax=Thalassobaculum litoreum DSM 18839 TaxID=1123362 RepID=A0A8G2BEI2_9PROT|nr:alpha/beta hydrolase [Thalassobaculum litoreum]SDF17882.1 Pimeloyl-ACP methyl ester carboxylesterase [Thalassobaculum litoreum DSM 18839]
MFTLPVAGTEIAVHRSGSSNGSGTPVVLLHCSAAGARQMQVFAEALRDRFTVGPLDILIPDLHGYGASATRQGAHPLRLAHEAAIVASLSRHVGGPVHVIGHSYGGAVALAAAHGRPDLVRSLVLIEPVSFHLLQGGDSRDDTLLAEIGRVAGAVRQGVLTDRPEAGMAAFVNFWSGPGSWEGLSQRARAAMAQHAPQVARNFQAAFDHPTRLHDITRFPVPTRLIYGGRTRPIARRIVELIERTLPDVSLRIVPEAGHMAPLSDPCATAALAAAQLCLIQPNPVTSAA